MNTQNHVAGEIAWIAEPPTLLGQLSQNWGWMLFRGIAAVVFGFMTLAWPGITLLALIWLAGIYLLSDGILAFGAGLFRQGGGIVPTWWLILAGALGIVAGVVVLVYPGMTALLLLAFIAAWALLRGISEIIGAIQLRKVIDNEWMLIVDGLLSIVFGGILLIAPGAGALAMAVFIGCYAIIIGGLLIAFSLRLRRHRHGTASQA